MKKLLVSLFAIVCVICLGTPVSADTNADLTVSFDELQFTVEDYDVDDPEIIYSKNGLTEVATVIDKNTGEVIETIELIPNVTNPFRSTVTSHTLKRSATFARTTIQLSINIELYNHGSFRQINSIQGHYLGIVNSITNTYIEGQNVNVWSPTGFPTTSLKYAYNGTLTAAVSSGATGGISAELLGAGFNFNGTVSGKSYYRYPFNQNGTISIY